MRLRRTDDFERLRAAGRRLAKGCLVANWSVLPGGAVSQLGVIAGKRLGPATVRHRAKRLLRETFRLHRQELSVPVKLVLVARDSIVGKKLADVERDFLALMRQARLLKESS